MVAPKKMIMGRGESAISIGRARSIARKPVVKVKPKTKTKVSEPKSNVKKLENSNDPKLRQKIINAQRTAAVNNARSGETARRMADLRKPSGTKRPPVAKKAFISSRIKRLPQ